MAERAKYAREHAAEGGTWAVAAEYQGAPVEPPLEGEPLDEQVELGSMTICGGKQTRITALVTAETEEEAREIGAAGIAEFARTLRLPAEPVTVAVTGDRQHVAA